jgi:hypothetical protein
MIIEDGKIHYWFELSYAQYLTIPRSVLQSMPSGWQERFVACLNELDETIDWRPKAGRYWVQLKDGSGRYTEDPLMDYERGRRHIEWRDGMMEYGAAIQACERGAVAEQRMWCIVPRGNERYSVKAQANLQEDEWSVFDADPADLPNPYPEV